MEQGEHITREEILEACPYYIEKGDLEILEKILDTLNIGNLPNSDAREIYYYFIAICHKLWKDTLIREISRIFVDRVGQEKYFEAYLFSQRNADEEVLKFFFQNNGRKFSFYLRGIFLFNEESDVHPSMENLEKCKSPTYDQWYKYLKMLYSQEDDETPCGEIIEEIMKLSASKVAPDSEKPFYILREEKIPVEKKLFKKLPVRPSFFEMNTPLEKIAEDRAHEQYKAGEILFDSIPYVRQNILKEIKSMTEEERTAYFQEYEADVWELSLRNDKELFRILGPCHPKYGAGELNTDSEDICARYGGCRMMTCIENEYDEEFTNSDPSTDWFTGSCDRCSKKIKYRHYATRILLEYGGFKGCYCSRDCVVSDCRDYGRPIAKKYTEEACDELEEIGIYERRWKDKIMSQEKKRKLIRRGMEFLNFLKNTEIEETVEIDFPQYFVETV